MSSRARAAGELRSRIEARSLRCSVLGLGLVGTILAECLHGAGFRVAGYDRSGPAVESFRRRQNGIAASTDPADLHDTQALIVAVRLRATAGDLADEPLRAVASLVATLSARPRLIALATTVPLGMTRSFAASLTEQAAETFVVHTPERIQTGDDAHAAGAIPHLVGGVDQTSAELGRLLLESFCDVVAVSRPEVSELAKLLENAFRAVGIALVSELTKIAHAADIPAREITQAAATKPFGYFPFHPGVGVGGGCLANDLRLLQISAAGAPSPLLEAALGALDDMPDVAVARIEHLLRPQGVDIGQAAVLLVGTGFKVASSEQTATPAGPLARRLLDRGASVSFFDAENERFVVDGVPLPRTNLEMLAAGASFDVAVVVAGADSLTPERLSSAATVVIDAGGGGVLPGGPAAMVPL
jgi:UDP-N-acetyl-D-glucosamine dehydrogenase